MKIHLGCGRHKLEGYVNVDAGPTNDVNPDMVFVLGSGPLPFKTGSAKEILAVHLFEHFYKWDAMRLLVDWKRILQGGGLLILEMPDLMKCCKNFVQDPNQHTLGMAGLYGDQVSENDFMTHKFGWYPESLQHALQEVGFVDIKFTTPQWHGKKKFVRDMRVEAVSP
jgi:predicted SAM-dependent methyltransferase